MVVTPVSFSPFMMLQWIGAAPLYLGKREAWTLTQPYLGISKIRWERIWPKATTTIRSGCISSSFAVNSSVLIFSGCSTGRLYSRAAAFTGDGWRLCPRPLGLSGWVTTAMISVFSCNTFKHGTAKSGVPINIVLILLISCPHSAGSWPHQ